MKKSLMISMIIILLIGIFGGTVNAAAVTSLSPSSKTVNVGENVTITLSFGQKVSAARFTVNFDSNKLQYISYSCTGSGYKEFDPNGTKRFAYAGTTDDVSSISFTFKSKAVGTTNVNINNVLISVGTQSRIPASMGNSTASITVKEIQSTVNNDNQQNNNTTNNNVPTTNNKPSVSTNTTTIRKKYTSTAKKATTKAKTTKTTKTTPTVVEEKTETQETIEEPVKETKQIAPKEIIRLNNKDVKTLENAKTGVTIKALPYALADDVILDVNIIGKNNIKYEKLNRILADLKGNKEFFNIKLLQNNIEIEPNGYVTVCIPIPEDYKAENIELYYINEDKETYELIEGEVQEDYFTFTTNHFSTYALVERVEDTEVVAEAENITDKIGNILQEIFNKEDAMFYKIIAGLVATIIILIIIIMIKKK